MLSYYFACALLVAGLGHAQNATGTATSTLEACGRISSVIASYAKVSPSATPFVDVQLAQDCYDSVPLDQTDATNLLDALSAMLEFQSDLAFLENPPKGYLLAGVDLLGEVKDLREQVTSGNVTGEISFEYKVATILAKAHDGHLSFLMDGLSILQFSRLTDSLVSVSMNGIDVPKIYLYADVIDYVNGSGVEPVAVTSVNGVEVEKYLLHVGFNTTLAGDQDPDAQYNSFFWGWNDGVSFSNTTGLFLGFFQEEYELYTNLTFENGTTVPTANIVIPKQDFTNVTDGYSFYQAFLNASAVLNTSPSSTTGTSEPTGTSSPEQSTDTASATATSSKAVTSIIGYPTPTAISSDGALSGYFLDKPGFEDTAVLAMRFMSEPEAASFQKTMKQFLAECRNSGKTHLIIDASSNPGGTVALAYDTLKQLFPSLTPYGAGNYRAQQGFELLGIAITNQSAEARKDMPNNYTAFINAGGTTDFDAIAYVDVNNTQFSDFGAYYGPVQAPNGYGNYTELSRTPLNDSGYSESTSGIVISGYGNNSQLAPQPFNNSNIIFLTDGQCGSTCTILGHFLKYQAKVKSIAMGGRPQTGAMQALGAIKGSEVQPFSVLNSLVNAGYSILDQSTLSTWTNTTLEIIYNLGDYLIARTKSAGLSATDLSFNLRNNIAEGDTSLTPLQYVYEAADCRLWFQPKHYFDITTIWTDVASQAFGLNGTSVFGSCVAGSTNQPSSLSGDPELYANGALQNATEENIGDIITDSTSSTPNMYTGAGGKLHSSYAMMLSVAALGSALTLI